MSSGVIDQIHHYLRRSDVEGALRLLRDGGYSKVQSIKALTDTDKISLAEAKVLVHESAVWRDLRQRDSVLQEALEEGTDVRVR